MSTKWFSTSILREDSPFKTPQDAYTTYMNILADFEMRLEVAEEDAAKRLKAASPEQVKGKKTKISKGASKSVKDKQLVA